MQFSKIQLIIYYEYKSILNWQRAHEKNQWTGFNRRVFYNSTILLGHIELKLSENIRNLVLPKDVVTRYF